MLVMPFGTVTPGGNAGMFVDDDLLTGICTPMSAPIVKPQSSVHSKPRRGLMNHVSTDASPEYVPYDANVTDVDASRCCLPTRAPMKNGPSKGKTRAST